MFSMLCCRY